MTWNLNSLYDMSRTENLITNQFLAFLEPFSDQIPIMGTHANSANPVQMPQNLASDQDLPCLLTEISMQMSVKVKTFTPKKPL